mmetsp:Transcript_4961/g.10000  ORF Transcript_4961/g.10000 Transcript_4961/m.10000 type:complete len:303 (+) Transcript_4961:2632-3540(+)
MDEKSTHNTWEPARDQVLNGGDQEKREERLVGRENFRLGSLGFAVALGAIGVWGVHAAVRVVRMGCMGSKEKEEVSVPKATKEKPTVEAQPTTVLKAPTITETDRVLLDLKNRRDELERQRVRLTANRDREQLLLRELAARKNVDEFRFVYSRKKLVDQGLTAATFHLSKIEESVYLVEDTVARNEVFKMLDQANQELKKLRETMTLDDVERILQDHEENKAHTQELQAVIAGSERVPDEEIWAQMQALTRGVEEENSQPMPSQEQVDYVSGMSKTLLEGGEQDEEKWEEDDAVTVPLPDPL